LGGPVRLLEHLLAASSMSQRHMSLMTALGVGALACRHFGVTSFLPSSPAMKGIARPADLPVGILLPVRTARSALATVRLFPDVSVLVRPPIDLGRYDPTLAASMDFGAGFGYLPVPFVANPPAIHRTDIALLTDDDVVALVLAVRLGVRVVSSCGDRMPRLAAQLVANLPGVRQIVVLRDAVLGDPESTFRRKLAVLGTTAEDVRVARWTLAEAIDANDAPALLERTVQVRRLGGSTHRSKGTLLLPPSSFLPWGQSLAASSVRDLFALGCDVSCRIRRAPKLGSPSAEYLYKLDRFADIRDEAERLGAQVALLGGAAVDALLGGVVRERKDLDLALTGGDSNVLESLTARLLERGFTVRFRSTASQVKLLEQGHRFEIFRLGSEATGALHWFGRNRYCRLGPDAIIEGRLAGRTLPVVSAEYLFLAKRDHLRDCASLRLRSFLERTTNYRTDLAALGTIVDRRRVRHLEHSGSYQSLRVQAAGLPPFRHRPSQTAHWPRGWTRSEGLGGPRRDAPLGRAGKVSLRPATNIMRSES